jgi:hypothetical protein
MRLGSVGSLLAAVLPVGASAYVATGRDGIPPFARFRLHSQAPHSRHPSAEALGMSPSPSSCDCEIGDGGGGAKGGGGRVAAESLRSSYVTNVRGELVSMNFVLGERNAAGSPTTLLVFLRHLG